MNKVSHLQQLVLGFAVCTGLEGESGVPISVSPLCYRPTGKIFVQHRRYKMQEREAR